MRNPCKDCIYYHEENKTCQSKKCATGGSGKVSWVDRLFSSPCKKDGGVNDEKLDAAPTVDAVEVVRCKDCEYSYDEISYLCCSHGVCADCEVPPNFYCADGKRKEPD